MVEPPQIAVGRAGRGPDGAYRTVARTAQVRLAADLVLDPLGTYAGVDVGPMQLPLALDAGRGTASLTDTTCARDETGRDATNLVATTAAAVVAGATSPEVLLAPSAAVVGTVRSPLVDLSVDLGAGIEVTVAEVTAAGTLAVPGTTTTTTLSGPFTARTRIAGNAPLDGAAPELPGLAGLVERLELETTVLDASPTLGLTVSVDGEGGSVNLTEDVLVPALADAAAVVRTADLAVGGVTELLGVATVGDADLAVAGVDCSGRRLVR